MLRRRFVRVIEKTLGLFPAYDEVGRLVNVVLSEQKKVANLRDEMVDFDLFLFDLREALRSSASDFDYEDALRVAKETASSLDAKDATIAKMRVYLERAARELGKDFAEDAKKEGLI